jgi:CheY-like chemotaxis protein
MFETIKPHLVLSDIGMAEQDGYELVRQLRQSGGGAP